jgi:hypothetical protein
MVSFSHIDSIRWLSGDEDKIEERKNKKEQFKKEVKPIKELMDRLGIADPQILIEYISVTQTIWSEWMSGWRRMPEEYREKILRYLNQDDKKKKRSFFL